MIIRMHSDFQTRQKELFREPATGSRDFRVRWVRVVNAPTGISATCSEPENNLSCKLVQKSPKICLILMQNYFQFFFHKPNFPVYNCAKLNCSAQSKF